MRAPLPLFAALALAGASSAFAGTTVPVTCPASSPNVCYDNRVPTGNLVLSPEPESSSLSQTTDGTALADTYVLGSRNSLAATFSRNTIVGAENNLAGRGGRWQVLGTENSIASDDINVYITGDGNAVHGTEGQNWGIAVMGGSNAVDTASGSVVGTGNQLTRSTRGLLLGTQSTLADSTDGIVIGTHSTLTGGYGGVVIGPDASVGANASESVALGARSVADRPGQVSIGNPDKLRTLSYLAAGTQLTDAVNVGQLTSVAQALGGGATVQTGSFIAPAYALSGGVYTNVGDALSYLDSKQAQGGSFNAPDPLALRYTSATHSDVTLGGTSGTTVHNLAPGRVGTDAANVDQVNAGIATAENWAKTYTDLRLAGLNKRIASAGAVGSVFGQLALSAGAVPQHDKLSMAVTSYRGSSAVGVAFVHRFQNDRVALSVGSAFAGSGTALGASVSIGLGGE